MTLTERQQREHDYYKDYYAGGADLTTVNFGPVSGKEERPWNSYWYVLSAIKDAFNPGMKILDFGCGTGEHGVLFASIGYLVYGFDISEQGIGAARRLAEKYGYGERVALDVMTAEALQFEDETFDVIAGIDILHHVDIPLALRECHRVLKPGGRAFFREPVEAPVFERLRSSALFERLVPREKSLERHITEDERKLARKDLDDVKRVFPETTLRRFAILSRLDRFVEIKVWKHGSFLEWIDWRASGLLPGYATFGGAVVMKLVKPLPAFEPMHAATRRTGIGEAPEQKRHLVSTAST